MDCIPTAHHATIHEAIEAFLEHHDRPQITRAMLAVAGPVEHNRANLTNHSWRIDGTELARDLGLASVEVLNDFEATAWSLPHLASQDLLAIGPGRAVRGAPMVVLGPGTGLGLACHIPNSTGGVVLATEGGHATLPATSAREDAIIEWLRHQYGHASIERAISGGGLENLYRAIAAIDGVSVPERTATEITQAGLKGTCPQSRAALDMFCALLGTVAGNAALSFGARGGVYIAGGIAPRILTHLAGSEFRARFEAKGRFRAYLEAIPTQVIIHTDATFIGMKALLESKY